MYRFLTLCFLLYSSFAFSNFCSSGVDEEMSGCNELITKVYDSIYSHLAEGCDCEAPRSQRVQNLFICLKNNCTSHCKAQVSQQMYGCEKVKSKEGENCEENCTKDCRYDLDNNAEAKQNCVRENKQIVAEKLMEICDGSRPDALICPGGDTRENHNCGETCKSVVNQQINGLDSNCGDITVQNGINNCLGTIQAGSTLPQTPSQLPKDFAWQKCDFGMPCAQRIERMFNTVFQQCNNLKEKATICCDDPVKCVEADSANKALFTDLSSAPAGMAEKCRLIKETFGDVGNVGQKMANQCRDKASACVQTCGEQIADNFRSEFHQTCAFDILKEETYDRTKHTCSPHLVKTYAQKYRDELAPLIAQCELAGSKSKDLAQSADNILKSALSASQCEEQARGGVDFPAPDPGKPRQAGAFATDAADGNASALPVEPTLTWRDSGKKDQPMRGSEGGGASPSRSLSAAEGLSEDIEWSQQRPGSKQSSRGSSNRAGSSKNGREVIGGGGADSAGAVGRKLQGKGKKPGDISGKAGEGAEEEEIDKLSQRQFAKTGGKKQNTRPSWDQIKPRNNLNTRISSFGSPHDDIFKRISNRIVVLCREEKLHCP